MFSVVVGQVVTTFVPEDAELALTLSAFEPIESHLQGFDASCNDGVIDVTDGCCVVDLYRGAWLFPAHFFKCISEWHHFGGTFEKCC